MSRTELLRNAPLRALLAAETISITGSQMTWLALPWFVLTTTGSATRMSVVIAAEIAAVGLLGLPGGKLLGRLGTRRTMLLCDGARAPLVALVPVLHWTGLLSFGALLAITFALGALSAPYFAAGRVIVPELIGEDERLVGQAAALFQVANRLTFLVGPVLGGILIGSITAPGVLLIDAVSYVAAFVLVAAFVPRRTGATAEEPGGIRDGLRFLVREPLLRAWTVALAIGDAAWLAFFISVPVLVVARFGSDASIAGWLIASFGIGAILGNAVAYRFLLERVEGLTLIATCIMGQALPLWLLAFELPAWGYSAALIASGVANGLVNPSLHSLMTLRIPPALRPSAMAAMMIVAALVQPLGLFAAGPVLDALGARPVLIAFAAVQTVMMAVVAYVSLRARAVVRPVTVEQHG
jgi:MFS family permease